MKRYGPVIAIVVVVAVIALVAVVAGNGSNETTSGNGTPGGTVAPATRSDVPLTFQEATEQGKQDGIDWVASCDKKTGRVMMPSVYAAPCLPKFTGDNGGNTTPGVTGNEIVVVEYVQPVNGDINAMFSAQQDDPSATEATTKAFVQMLSDLYPLYGRTVNWVRYPAGGASNDAVAAHADAVTVIDRYHPFASIGGPLLTPAYAEELARNGVLCIDCGISLPDQFYQDHAPYIWGPTPTPEEFIQNLGDFLSRRVIHRPAKFAGDPTMRDRERSIGVVSFEQDPPQFTALTEAMTKCGRQVGFEAAASETYTFDIGKMPERAPTIIAKMKAAGVTTIMFLGDPIMPIYLTRAAEAADYHPEWIITGTPLSDTTVLGRFYEPNQWKHAFGISNLGARTQVDQQEPYRLHQWYYGRPPAATNTSALIYRPIAQLMLGLYLAGPRLTAETFKAGMFHYPKSGGGITTPQVSYGDHGYFKVLDPATCQPGAPRVDYLGSDDVTEIWWDAEYLGPDEQGRSDKPGTWRYANHAKRYLPGSMPSTEVDAFKMENTVVVVDEVPPAERAPDYPSPNQPLPT